METNGAAFAAVGAGISPACRALPVPGLIHKPNGGSGPTGRFVNCFPTPLFPESDFSNAAAAAAAAAVRLALPCPPPSQSEGSEQK